MKWENAEKIWPKGYVEVNDKIYSLKELQKSDVPMIQSYHQDYARNMLVRNAVQAWGENGEYMQGDDYNVFSLFPIMGDEPLLNCYGTAMLFNYVTLNNIDLNQYNEEFLRSE